MAWQLQEAKQRFSEVVQRSLDEGPQVVTRRGRETAVVLSMDEYRKLRGDLPEFKEFLLSIPDLGPLEITRDGKPARLVDL